MTRVVVSAFRVADRPDAAGHFWVYAQYVDALRRLGCDVWWLEELPPPDDPERRARQISVLLRRLGRLGLEDKVILYEGTTASRAPGPTYLTVRADLAHRVLHSSDLLLNFHYEISADLLGLVRRSALVDIDPGMLQLWWQSGLLDVRRHDVYFSIGENLELAGADAGITWLRTTPAVSLDLWPYHYDPGCRAFTGITSWRSRSYLPVDGTLVDSNKSVSYLTLLDLPRLAHRPLELATTLNHDEEADRLLLESHGWRVLSANEVVGTPDRYRSYIQRSRGELGCAKPAYVELGVGWISDRTACYLASGKPAVVQDTGPVSSVPDGLGLFRYRSTDEAAAALEQVDAAYERNCRAARELAESCFAATDVVTRLLDRALR